MMARTHLQQLFRHLGGAVLVHLCVVENKVGSKCKGVI